MTSKAHHDLSRVHDSLTKCIREASGPASKGDLEHSILGLPEAAVETRTETFLTFFGEDQIDNGCENALQTAKC